MRKSLCIILLTSALGVVGLLSVQKIHADPGGRAWGCGYFTNNCGHTSGFNRVFVNGIDIAPDKGTFIGFVESKVGSGDARERTGAAFIIQTMRGNVSRNRPPTAVEIQDWKNRINSGNISISRENYSYTWNSGYAASINDDVFYPDHDTRLSLVFRDNGRIVYALKIDCANVVGELPGIPPPPPPQPPASGYIQGRIFKDDNANGNRDAGEEILQYPGAPCGYRSENTYVQVSGIGNVVPNNCNPEPHYGVNVPVGWYNVTVVPPSGWQVTTTRTQNVYVPPGGTSQPGDPWFGVRPDTPPTGTMNATCDIVSGAAQDPDRPSAQLRVHLYVNGTFRGDYPTNAAHQYSINVTAFKGFVASRFEVYAIGVNTAGSPSGVNPRLGSIDVGPCLPAVSCGNLTTSLGAPEETENFTARVNIAYNIGASGALPTRPTYKMTLSIPGASFNNNNVAYSANTSGASFTSPTFSLPAGSYAATWSFSGPGINTGPCSGTFTVVKRPYFRVYNGDVSAGVSVNCSGWTDGPVINSRIIGYNDGNGKGSGAQLAAFAIDTIEGFSTATGRNSNPKPPNGLSFANTAGTGTYGGKFGSSFCPPDYFSTKPSGAVLLGNIIDTGPLASGTYQTNGDVTINGNLADGKQLTLYVDGNAYISTGGITDDGTWNTVGDIPSFTLIVKGNIYIDSNVTSINGVYIAQPKAGAQGELITCAPGFRLPTNNELIANCQRQLLVNGALMAKKIRLLRTQGSLRNGANIESRSSGAIAEVITFSPEVWLRQLLSGGDSSSPDYYESITSLPPIL